MSQKSEGGGKVPFMRDRLKQRRIDMGLTLQEIADIIGVEKPTVQRYESGKISKLDTLTVERLSDAVRCNPAYLMGWSDSPNIDVKGKLTLGERIVSFRAKRNMVQKQLAKIAGISEYSLDFYEKDERKPDTQELKKIAVALEITDGELMGLPVPVQSEWALTAHERGLITAYRDNPAMQAAVDRLLNVDTEAATEITPDIADNYEAEANAIAELARQQFLDEKRRVSKAYPVKESGAG